jgi:hypothetical protein
MYAGLSMAMVVLIATLTVTASRSGPPAIAELSPSAVQQIKDAPKELSSSIGSADGDDSGDAADTTTTVAAASGGATTTTAPAIERARIRRCVGSPPRQTEDPQSPPCVAFWSGNNGGSTYQGVDGGEIRVMLPFGSERVRADLEAYFNSRFEFYGRHLRLIPTGDTGYTCAMRKAATADAQNKFKAFATLTANGDGNGGVCYNAEIARRKMLSVMNMAEFTTGQAEASPLNPYLWMYTTAHDKLFAMLGEVACKQLAGSTARYSTDPALAARTRTFGVIVQQDIRDTDVDIGPLQQALSACGESVHVFRYGTNEDPGNARPELATQAIIDMQTAQVTTVICLCLVFVQQYLPPAANRQNYYPEWMFSTYGANDLNQSMKVFWPDTRHRAASFGVGVRQPMRSLDKEAYYYALHEVDPALTNDNGTTDVYQFMLQYQSLLLLASGIQMAGPTLNPDTFAAAMRRTRFPNTDDFPSAARPSLPGHVGFNDGDRSMIDDAVEYWWSETAPAPRNPQSISGPGAWCYIDNGARHRISQFPEGKNPFFAGVCNPDP